MNKAYNDMTASLAEFADDSKDYHDELPESQAELLNASRVVKYEVINTADMMDKMSLIMLKQGQQIQQQSEDLRSLRNLINKDGGDQIEEPAVVAAEANEPHADDDIPDLFSLRRSPFYQGTIQNHDLLNPLLGKTTNLKHKMAKDSDFYRWNRKAEA